MQTQRILIIEDEKPIADLLAYGLKQEGFIAYQAQTGADGLELCRTVQPDLLLLDWMLPDCSGTDLCRMITQEYNIPIIMLTARSHIEDKVHGLEAGADDYITKPFDLREVLVRIRTILRRVNRATVANSDWIACGDLRISATEMTVMRGETAIDLTPREFQLLLYLIEHPNQVFTRTLLLDQIWDYSYAGDTRTVDIHIQRLRKKCGLAHQIQTVFGVGYKYVPSA